MTIRMDLSNYWAMACLISCVIWLVMGSRANSIAYATQVVGNRKRLDSGEEEVKSALVKSIASGLQLALNQCAQDFKWDRWNCPETDFSRQFSLPSTREMSYVSAVTAAGLAYSVARDCARGQVLLGQCSCGLTREAEDEEAAAVEREKEQGAAAGSRWKWQNCASDLEAGQRVSQLFLDSLEGQAKDIRALANSHNFRLGRKSVEREPGEECKCHGLSGSCTTRTCWGRVAPFAGVGRRLKERYLRALRVAANHSGRKALLSAALSKEGEMVFLEESPDFCKPNATSGWPGTEGRVCSRRRLKESTGEDVLPSKEERRSCRELCRSCGHQVRRRPVQSVWKCNCTFHWCCNVTCSLCTKTQHEYFCDASPSTLVKRSYQLAVLD